MSREILTVAACYEADKYAAAHGTPTLTLMERAGQAVADEICKRWRPRIATVLCGPGNNGGDGFVVARLLKERGWDVSVPLLGSRTALKGDAAAMAQQWSGGVEDLSVDTLDDSSGLIVDALFGAGLSRPLEGAAKDVASAVNARKTPVVSIDVPSGVQGDSGKVLGEVCIEANLTVTFFRKKPAHVLMPGRDICGEIAVADIGIPDAAAGTAMLFENGPELWGNVFRWPDANGYKYTRGHCVVVSGPAHATGAARLAARGALRSGAGLVSVASPTEAVAVNAATLTAIMVKPFSGAGGLAELLTDSRLNAIVAGPGLSVDDETRELVAAVLASKAAVVLDADGLTSFKASPDALFAQLRAPAVLTPHDGEFGRLFGSLLTEAQSKVEAVRSAAATANCTVLLKGADTVIAAPDGRAVVNTNAPPSLATAGSGDVLSGIIGGLMAQGMDSFDAACAGVWLHGEAANCFGIGLIAEDIPETLPQVLRALHDRYPPAK
ncbi:MAG TPA: NAD(P)H-hydrate dehydratase [Rhizomicrobium sp.]|jgi:NAD(P)H-hydrate epimerase|nr:NAD(P)H-hydrate dehydratase [Rhizomicrobium sp.]